MSWTLSALLTTTAVADTRPAIGWGQLGYELPAVGSYALPALGPAADGMVLDTDGQPRRLHDLFGGKHVLLAFMYSSCSDLNGCPLTAHVFYQLKARMQSDPTLREHLTLISLSFDPAFDTPAVMQRYANNFEYAGEQGRWAFATTASEQQLRPILAAYNQTVQPQVDPKTGEARGISHILRVFLIDPQQRIRNIYSADFLHEDLILTDFKTLLAHAGVAQTNTTHADASAPALAKPGDDKQGYDSQRYQTNSRALINEVGKPTDLLALAQNPPLGLPPVPQPADNPLSQEKIALGRRLFFDRRLSLNNTFSCAMCHVPDQGFTSNELATAVGMEGRTVRRNTPTLYNVAFASRLFHDAREDTLEQQIWGPLLSPVEMANPSVGHVLSKLRQTDDYAEAFGRVFGEAGISMATLGMALASYQRSLVSADSAFDRWHFAGDEQALGASARRGFELFTGKARCVSCHTIAEDHALFTDNGLHNLGTGFRASMGLRPETMRVTVAPGVSLEVKTDIIDAVAEPAPADVGRYEVTQDPADRWRYKTPSLRNIALTAPYMHNGSLSTLADVIDFYNAGGVPNEGLSPLIQPLNLSAAEQADLVAFLTSLTGSNVETLVSDAFAAPIGDVKRPATPAHSTGSAPPNTSRTAP